MSLDQTLFLWINGFAGRITLLDEFLKGMANDYFFIVGSCLILVALWFGTRDVYLRRRNQRGIISALLSLGIAQGIVCIINLFYFRPRPFTELPAYLLFYLPTDSSFPSNSTSVIFALATAILLVDKKTGSLLLTLALVHGFSRIYVGIHYPLDILGGIIIGVLVALVVSRLLNRFDFWPNYLLKFIRKFYLA